MSKDGEENDIVESNGKSIFSFPPSDQHPLAPLDSANQNPLEKCCQVTSDHAGKKRAATSSPRTLATSSQNDQGHQLEQKKPNLESLKKCLDSKFDASLSDKCFGGKRVLCIQENTKSKFCRGAENSHFFLLSLQRQKLPPWLQKNNLCFGSG
jgi:hypothetical protein